MSAFWELGDVDAFTTGTVGRPGQRVFYVQVRSDGRRITVKCEKQQVGALAEYLQRLLEDLPAPTDLPMQASLELIGPEPPDFVAGPMGLGYDSDLDRFVILLEEAVLVEISDDADEAEAEIEIDDEAPDGARLRCHLTRGQARAFCDLAESVVSAGRPPCLFCGLPIDPDGHPCPRMN
ncbi:MAG: DUF3090 family protein [Ilumatobacteraceae bacterium]